MLPRESIPCDICRVDEAAFVCEARSLYAEETFRIVRCRRCGLVYVNPRQQEAAKLAQLAGLSGCSAVEENQERDASVYQVVLDCLEARGRRGSLLDVGAATGGFLREAGDRGWQVTGVEAAKPLAAFATETCGLPVFGGTLEEAGFPDASFDAVVMVHTIEHLYHPSRTVAEVFRVLKPGGYFYSMTPDLHHYAVRVVQCVGLLQEADRLDPTAHPYYFTPTTHATLVRRQGFRIVWCGSPISGLFAERNGCDGWVRKGLRLTARPAVWLSRFAPIGSTVQCLAQRPLR